MFKKEKEELVQPIVDAGKEEMQKFRDDNKVLFMNLLTGGSLIAGFSLGSLVTVAVYKILNK